MPQSKANAAIVYAGDNFQTNMAKLMGRNSASEGFLRAFVQHSGLNEFFAHSLNRKAFDEFAARVPGWATGPSETKWVPFLRPEGLRPIGCLYRPGPNINFFAWFRRRVGERAYSICGVTHTTAEQQIMDNIGQFLVSPVQSWDAVICTSEAVKSMVVRVQEDYGDFLGARFGAKVRSPVQLPVIPLGVDSAAFAPSPAQREAGARLRAENGISPDAFVVLFVGRLSPVEKANPLPMYLALERAAAAIGRPVWLVQSGWFPDEATERAYRGAAARFAPHVQHVFLDGRKPELRTTVWHMADVFCSLSDNIQETFGLTPIEAMAAGLPVVVSDWDGYRDTVRDGVDGIRVPTTMPPPGEGGEFAFRHSALLDGYLSYCGGTSRVIAVDVAACAAAFVELARNADLRARMGAAGQSRARDVLDWRHIIHAYQALWDDLAARRARDAVLGARRPGEPVEPLRNDPFTLFAAYPTGMLDDAAQIAPDDAGDAALLEAVRQSALATVSGQIYGEPEEMRLVLDRARGKPGIGVGQVLAEFPAPRRPAVRRAIAWLAKFGFLKARTAGAGQAKIGPGAEAAD